jgi:hypothetical protein
MDKDSIPLPGSALPTPRKPETASETNGASEERVLGAQKIGEQKIGHRQNVLEKEAEAIQQRRGCLKFRNPTRAGWVGLTFSGGGIRSASFNLGLLQALYRSGLIRFVDYLSTVSGGSYIGAWFSQQVGRLQGNDPIITRDNSPLVDGKPIQGTNGASASTASIGFNGTSWEPNSAISRLLKAGHSLSHPLLFANRYFVGLVKTNLVLVSILLLLCAGLALIWRILDMPVICESILALTGGVLIEAVRPFMVPVIFFLAWSIGWFVVSISPRRSKMLFAGVMLVFSGVTVGLAVLESFDDYRQLMEGHLWGFVWRPDSGWWKLLRPMPLLLTLAWPLAWTMTTPPEKKAWRLVLARSLFSLVAIVVAAFVWLKFEGSYKFSPQAEVAARAVIVLLSMLAISHGVLAVCLARGSPDRDHLAHRNLRWFLLLAGASFLVAGAVWLANPSINYTTTTTTQTPKSFTEGRAESHGSWINAILGVLVTSLLPFLRPRRLLESGLHPKNFWEPWVFRIACMAAVIGIPLVGVYFFARHNISGHNTSRSFKVHPTEFDWGLFWQRMRHDHESVPGSPGDVIWEALCGKVCNDGDAPITFEELLTHKDIARIVREQPHPLSPRIAHRKQWVVDTFNDYLFPEDATDLEQFAKLNQTVFGQLIAEQQRLESRVPREAHPEFDKRPWPSWGDIRVLLRQVDQRDPNTEAEVKSHKETYRRLNRLLLEGYFSDELSKKTRVLRPVVIQQDQLFRLGLVGVLSAGFFLSAWRVRVNSTSLHQYYRTQLSQAYLGIDPDKAEKDNGSQRLSCLDTVSHGGPYHLIGAALNIPTIRELMLKAFGASTNGDQGGTEAPNVDDQRPKGGKQVPSQTRLETSAIKGGTDAFVFSHQFCGSDYTGFEPTRTFEARSGVRVADGVALSGAAVSLTQINNPVILLFMAALNLRLGQWLPRPEPGGSDSNPARPPNLLELLRERPGLESRRHFFVTDGGHHDNLGVDVLLRRGCRLIIVSDATCDPNYEFVDFLRVWRREYRDHGIQILLDRSAFDQVRPQNLGADRRPPMTKTDAKEKSPDSKTTDAWSPSHYFVAYIEYPGAAPDTEKAVVIYLKPSITGDEPQDLRGFWAANAAFPHDPTSNQFYDENMVESYRQLGEHIGEQLCESLAKAAGVDFWEEKEFGIHDWVNHWLRNLQGEESHQRPSPTDPLLA